MNAACERGGVISPLGHCCLERPPPHPAAHFISRRPSPSGDTPAGNLLNSRSIFRARQSLHGHGDIDGLSGVAFPW